MKYFIVRRAVLCAEIGQLSQINKSCTHLSSNFQVNGKSWELIYPGIIFSKETQQKQTKYTHYTLKPCDKQWCIKLKSKTNQQKESNHCRCHPHWQIFYKPVMVKGQTLEVGGNRNTPCSLKVTCHGSYRILWEKIQDFSRTKIIFSRTSFPQ